MTEWWWMTLRSMTMYAANSQAAIWAPWRSHSAPKVHLGCQQLQVQMPFSSSNIDILYCRTQKNVLKSSNIKLEKKPHHNTYLAQEWQNRAKNQAQCSIHVNTRTGNIVDRYWWLTWKGLDCFAVPSVKDWTKFHMSMDWCNRCELHPLFRDKNGKL